MPPDRGVVCDCSPERYALAGFTCYGCRYSDGKRCTRGRRGYPLFEQPCGWRREKEVETDD